MNKVPGSFPVNRCTGSSRRLDAAFASYLAGTKKIQIYIYIYIFQSQRVLDAMVPGLNALEV